jgi:uncharacterized protein
VDNQLFKLNGRTDRRLSLLNQHDIVLRKTNFICPRTMSIGCDKASSDIQRQMVNLLQKPETKGFLRITVG